VEVSGELHAPAALLQGKYPWYLLVRGWVGPRANLDAAVKREIPIPAGYRNLVPPIVQSIDQSYTE